MKMGLIDLSKGGSLLHSIFQSQGWLIGMPIVEKVIIR